VRAAVDEVDDDASVIIVHDAARPLIDDDVIERVLKPLSEGFDGAVPTMPITDTVKRARGGEIVETLDRAELVAVQTPQAFLADTLRRALGGDISSATDCSSLVEAAGGRVAAVAGDARLLKVTEVADLELVERLL
jgi:2-C-methyl-D-erythritol 4-phosphate cytidylyltransferase